MVFIYVIIMITPVNSANCVFLCESRALRSWFTFTIFYSCFQCFWDFLKAKPQCPHWCRCMPIRPAGKPTLCDDDDEWSWLKLKKKALPVDGIKHRVSRVVKPASTLLLNFGIYSTSGLENSDNQRVRHGMNGVALRAVRLLATRRLAIGVSRVSILGGGGGVWQSLTPADPPQQLPTSSQWRPSGPNAVHRGMVIKFLFQCDGIATHKIFLSRNFYFHVLHRQGIGQIWSPLQMIRGAAPPPERTPTRLA